MSPQFTSKYSSDDFHEPAPVIKLTISNVGKQDLVSIADFLIDTGSDISFIKSEIFSILELIIVDEPVTFLVAYVLK